MRTAGPLENLPDISPADKSVTVLGVSPYEEDHACLRAIFGHSNWKIFEAHTCHEAVAFLSKNRIAVVVCERHLLDGDWKTLLDSLSAFPLSPRLVVASRDVDDTLWSEVLNRGAYDVLSKPFDRVEVMRIISLAWLHWKEQARRPQKSAARTAAAGGIQRSIATTAC